MWVVGPKQLGSLLLRFPGHGQGAGWQVEQLELRPVPVWDASMGAGSFSRYAAVLAPGMVAFELTASALVPSRTPGLGAWSLFPAEVRD